MAMYKIGKLKFKFTKDGLVYRWGNGEIKRLFDGQKKANGPDDIDENDAARRGDGYDDSDYDDDGYDDGYDDDQDYADPGYDDGYDDDGYDDRDYDDERDYDDGYADDDGYDDGGDYDDDDYDDRYSDEDAGEGDYYPAEPSPLMQYIDENDWVTYLLLFLFPPLGIYLLWHKGMFDEKIRIGISAASAIWFLVALILIFTSIFGSIQDRSQEAAVSPTPSPTAQTLTLIGDGSGEGLDVTLDNVGSEDEDVTPDPTALGSASLTSIDAAPSPTPLADAASAALTSSAYVYSPATGLYYHSSNTCTNIDQGVSVSRVPREVAENNRKQSACPVCIGAAAGLDTTTYYATQTGEYYHKDQYCNGMTGATAITKEAAELRGKKACPKCVTGIAASLREGDVKFIKSSTDDKSKINVYTTKGGKYYHLTSDCSGMTGASKGSLKAALLAGKKACPTCCKAAGTTVYCTEGGKMYHLNKTCSGMTSAMGVTLAEALVLGKDRCGTCVKSGLLPTASQLRQAAEADNDGSYVYGTPNGQYYHTDPNCSSMKDAQRYKLKSMLLKKRKPCPKCASDADTVVYATRSGKYYHSYATCSNMTTATEGTMAEAISQGYKRCPRCWSETTSMAKARAKIDEAAVAAAAAASSSGSSSSSSSSSSGSSSSSSKSSTKATPTKVSTTATAKNTYVYATRAGSYYHLTSNCSGMKGASRITLKQAINAGKKACPTCAGSANRTVYSTDKGDHYHSSAVCPDSGMKNGKKRTLSQALMLGQTACKYCWGKKASTKATPKATAKPTATPKPTANSKNANTKNANTKNVKPTPTPTPSPKTVASIKAAEAKLTNSHTYKSGKSGIYVYCRADGKYYHRNSSCSGMTNASRVTLETAMNYGKKACPTCCSTARRTVYATRGGKYYHYSKDHAGSGAKSGSLASAVAYGYSACPYCVTKTKTVAANTPAGKSSNTFKSGKSGIKVYATVTGKYYHSKSGCSGMENASHITLETALNYGKKACPKCMSAASMKVYSSSGDKYYHYYKLHAGSSAKAGTLAEARAYGKKMCSTCSKLYHSDVPASALSSSSDAKKLAKFIDATEDMSTDEIEKALRSSTDGKTTYSEAPVSKEKYSASADSNVYVDLGGDYYFYYHKSSRCSDTHMKSGTTVKLQYAKDWGYLPCPYCNPPTSIKD